MLVDVDWMPQKSRKGISPTFYREINALPTYPDTQIPDTVALSDSWILNPMGRLDAS